jgi:hypothetical protein
MQEKVQWSAPAPLWASIAASDDRSVRHAMLQPAILRFATDSFMEEFTGLLTNDPGRLSDFLALPETWRGPLAPPDPVQSVSPFLLKNPRWRFLPTATKQELARDSSGALGVVAKGKPTAQTLPPLKLYQPAHQRFYLVAGGLVCQQAGLPDHAVAANRQERVSYVVRRLLESPEAKQSATGEQTLSTNLPAKSEAYDEYAFVTTPGNKGWQKIEGERKRIIKDEEQTTLFPMNFTDENGHPRRLFAGLIPVSRREAYMGAQSAAAPAKTGGASGQAGGLPKTARKILLRTQVSEPWKRILDRSFAIRKAIETPSDPEPTNDQKRNQLREAREQLQVSSWYVLLDLAKFLHEHVNAVWTVVIGQAAESSLKTSAQQKLLGALKNTISDATLKAALRSVSPDPIIYTEASVKANLLAALKAIKDPQDDWEERLDQVKTPYLRNSSQLAAAWPAFLFPLADPDRNVVAPQVPNSVPPLGTDDKVEAEAVINDPPTTDAAELQKQAAHAAVDRLTALVVRAMPDDAPTIVPEPPLASQKPLDMREGLFVIRFVYERPWCGPLEPPEVSQPTTPFQMAGYFDPDAPARPIRIALPLDTSPAGLRKFDKNTAFAISDVLCGQMQRLRSLTFGDLVLSVLPWPFHKDLSASAPDSGACTGGGGVEIGMICSISIPIVTICALLLLMIIVNLLDIVFRWLPYFFICFPIPGLKAKK